MLADYHLHTSFSGDSQTPPADQAEAACRLGIPEICITDHHDYGTHEMTRLDFHLDLPAYFPAMEVLRKTYAKRLPIYTGIELGLMMRQKEYLEQLEKKLPVDFIIGSSHFVDGYDTYDPEYYAGRPEKESYLRYFVSTLERIRAMDCFDSLGHLDYIIRYGPNKNKNYDPADYMDVIDQILKTLIQKGKALECNTAGFKYGLNHPNPDERILKRYRELGGELLTVGSDGHRPNEVGGFFTQTEEILLQCGFRYYTVYHERKPVFLRLGT